MINKDPFIDPETTSTRLSCAYLPSSFSTWFNEKSSRPDLLVNPLS